MLFHTYLQEMVDFWKERGCDTKLHYRHDGVDTWEITVPDDHPDLRHPEYVGLLTQETLFVLPQVVLRRLQPPIYTFKVGKSFANIQSRSGQIGMPFARKREILEAMLNRSANISGSSSGETAKIVKLTQHDRIVSLLQKAKNQSKDNEDQRILIFVEPHVCEVVPVESALNLLKQMPQTQQKEGNDDDGTRYSDSPHSPRGNESLH